MSESCPSQPEFREVHYGTAGKIKILKQMRDQRSFIKGSTTVSISPSYGMSLLLDIPGWCISQSVSQTMRKKEKGTSADVWERGPCRSGRTMEWPPHNGMSEGAKEASNFEHTWLIYRQPNIPSAPHNARGGGGNGVR